jgi:zona occludens toxin (predicted ATPase)
MIYLITGVPGSGKTLYSIRLIKEWLKEGRTVYADIDGLNIPNVLPSPPDWRNTPEGSVVVYDECQKIFPSDGKAGVATDERMRAMETHRHTGHDLVFITQAPTFVHHHIRKLTGKHIHAYRALGLKGCTLFKWDGICDNPNGFHERKQADTERWTYPPELFQCYKSATVHTHKFKMPRKILVIGAFALFAIFGAIAYGMNSDLAKTIDKTDGSTSTARSAPEVLPISFKDTTLQEVNNASSNIVSVSGCVSGKFCRCFDREGNQLDLGLSMCRNLSEGNLALPIKIDMGKDDKKS